LYVPPALTWLFARLPEPAATSTTAPTATTSKAVASLRVVLFKISLLPASRDAGIAVHRTL
jgi:hypothetical protein